jgi:hypothetical protein
MWTLSKLLDLSAPWLIVVLVIISALAVYLCVAFGVTANTHATGASPIAHDAVSAAANEHIDVMMPPGYIDDVPVTQKMRILLMAQRRQKDNGIYEMALRGLVRAKDHARPKLVRDNMLIYVSSGTRFGGMVMISRVLRVYDASYANPDLHDNWPPVAFLALDVGHRANAVVHEKKDADAGWSITS